jgi:TetR/AcrR family transcriptional regulator, transcriptional repressor for nem operon
MRKSREEAAQTRQRIVETAALEFRRGGIVSTGVADVMAAAGLTQGGFYRHFESKDALVKESLANALDSLTASIEGSMANRPGRAGVLAAIEDYLSADHRDNPSSCPFVSFGSELARESQSVRDEATNGLSRLVNALARNLTGVSPASAKKESLVILSTMIGAMTVARLVSDKELSAALLTQAKKSLFELVRANSS